MNNRERYQQRMQSWPSLEGFAKTITIPNLELNLFVYDSGDVDKKPLIMIHGLGDEADTWRHVFNPIARFFRVIAFDLPGFGRSDKPDRDYSPKFMMNSVLGLSDQLNLSEIILMGSSMGGILAHSMALKYANRIQGLILVGGSLLQVEPMVDKGLALMKIPLLGEWLYTRLRKDPDSAYDSLRNVYFDLDKLPGQDRDFLFQRVNQRVWNNNQRRAYFSSLRNLYPWVKMSQSNLLDQLTQLTTPTLVIRGEHDPLMSPKNAEGLSKVQPNATLAVIEGAGHLPHQEKPSPFLEVAINWLSEVFASNLT